MQNWGKTNPFKIRRGRQSVSCWVGITGVSLIAPICNSDTAIWRNAHTSFPFFLPWHIFLDNFSVFILSIKLALKAKSHQKQNINVGYLLTKLDKKHISDMFTEIHHSLWQVMLTVIPWVILSPSLPLANQLSTASWIRRDWNTNSSFKMCYGNWGIQVVQNGYFEIVVLENSSQVFDSDPYESPRPWPPLQVPVTYYRGDFPARRLPSNALN